MYNIAIQTMPSTIHVSGISYSIAVKVIACCQPHIIFCNLTYMRWVRCDMKLLKKQAVTAESSFVLTDIGLWWPAVIHSCPTNPVVRARQKVKSSVFFYMRYKSKKDDRFRRANKNSFRKYPLFSVNINENKWNTRFCYAMLTAVEFLEFVSDLRIVLNIPNS